MLQYLRGLSTRRKDSVDYFSGKLAVSEELGELLFQRNSLRRAILWLCRIDLFLQLLYLFLLLLYLL